MNFSRWFRRKNEFEQQMSEELRFHLDKQIAVNIAAGMTPAEARRQAKLQLGAGEGVKENCREQRRGFWLETLWADVRYGLRILRKSPGFTAVAVLTLALGIGANTSIFSIVNAVFLRPLPFPHAGRIFVIHRTGNQFGGISISMPIYLAWQPQAGIFDHLALVHWRLDASLTGAGEPERIPSALISPEFLPAIGVQPAIGRNFRPDEGRTGGENVVMIANDLWRNRFGADPNALGREITLDGQGYTIVGILPRGLDVPLPSIHGSQIFFPLQVPAASQDPSNSGMLAVGLLKRGVTPEEAAAKLTPPLSQLRAEFPKMFAAGERVHLTPLRDILREWAGPAPLLLFGAVGLVLLIACANVANLSLSRSTARQHEIAIRVAIGAGRRRIARQLLTESVLLSLLGGILGVIACYASFHLIVGLVPTDLDMPHVGAYRIDATVLGFALLLSVATGILFGFAPALSASRVDLNASLQETGPRAGSGRHGRLRQTLAISEIAISVVLLIGAALALESFASLVRVQPGFDANNVTTAQFSLPEKQYDTPAKRQGFIAEGIRRLAALPGVESASMIDTIPLREGGDTLINIEGRPDNPNEVLGAEIRAISPGVFHTLRVPLVRGRNFSNADNANSRPVVIIDQAMASAYWPRGDAMGAHIWIGRAMGPKFAEPAAREVVGIVGSAREMSLAQAPWPTMYLPADQTRHGVGWGYFLIRSERGTAISATAIRSALLKLDPANPPSEIIPLEQTVSASLTDWRFRAVLLGVFAGLAFFIAMIGVYGVISYAVAQRTHEIGIRVALGAQRTDVLKLVLGQGAGLALAGVAIGIAITLALTRVMASVLYGVQYEQPPMLYGVRATDPLTISGVAILLAAVALLASYIPARRAMQVDPVVALRHE
jgi:putative ABC transport system permease protein